MSGQYQSCIAACIECAQACDVCASACLKEDDVTPLAGCIALDTDCAQLCRLAVGAMERGSPAALAICKACAEVCDLCAAECYRHAMWHCEECAAACLRCMAQCNRMVELDGRAESQGQRGPRGGKAATARH
ncbi:four-helix bundle copper-binding protein [Massilia sp. BJB1822]|uniref:four-helix bundle copper-binding protein n=1 Tax=Massilia sp. BJB1822 TaxID=2744470 RepID=UPI001E36BCB9|nr:four-helix bundle copper-binding protein [Massilia sp. BJB1822]